MHKHFLVILLFIYLLGALFPLPGEAIRNITLGKMYWFDGSSIELSLPLFMLSFLLFNAGLSIKAFELTKLFNRPQILFWGLIANLLIPIVFTFFVSSLGIFWKEFHEVQSILVGLALIASMPIAGSSTVWSSSSNGNLVLSLGLVVFSTILSPVITPITLNIIGFMAQGDYASDLHELAANGTGAFLAISVVIPSLLGTMLHFALGEKRTEEIKPFVKTLSLLNLLILSYSNAAIVLPLAFREHDWDFLLIVFFITSSLCVFAFFTAWLIAKFLKIEKAEQSSLMFGLGMNNNGTGLVLASIALADHPLVMLPIIFYNIIQNIIAGLVTSKFFANESK